jgi:hypothetical protein
MYGSQPSGEPTTEQSETPTPPGSDLFEQAVALLNVSSEEPTTEDVEALNLMVSDQSRKLWRYLTYNRRSTATP